MDCFDLIRPTRRHCEAPKATWQSRQTVGLTQTPAWIATPASRSRNDEKEA
jgi:hypothetical protein